MEANECFQLHILYMEFQVSRTKRQRQALHTKKRTTSNAPEFPRLYSTLNEPEGQALNVKIKIVGKLSISMFHPYK
jgi:hypothetical protein